MSKMSQPLRWNLLGPSSLHFGEARAWSALVLRLRPCAPLLQSPRYLFQTTTTSHVRDTRFIRPDDPVPDSPKLRPRTLAVDAGCVLGATDAW